MIAKEYKKIVRALRRYLSAMYGWWVEPPDHALNKNLSLRAALASDWREIIILDVIIWAFLLSSIHQVGFVFGKGNPSNFDYLKAFGLDAAIWIISKAIAKSYIMSDRLDVFLSPVRRRYRDIDDRSIFHRIFDGVNWKRVRTQSVLWFGLLVFLFLTTSFNVVYEMWDHTGSTGDIRLISGDSDATVFIRYLSSVYLAFVIIFLTFVRMLLQKNMSSAFQETEEKQTTLSEDEQHRERERIRQRERRERIKVEQMKGAKNGNRKKR